MRPMFCPDDRVTDGRISGRVVAVHQPVPVGSGAFQSHAAVWLLVDDDGWRDELGNPVARYVTVLHGDLKAVGG